MGRVCPTCGNAERHAEPNFCSDAWHAHPVGRCSGCGRRTWDSTMIGQTCFAPQAGGEPCQGKFNSVSIPFASSEYWRADGY